MIEDGGYAFPQQELTGMGTLTGDGMFQPHYQVTGGMTLRDYAAIEFAAALLSNPNLEIKDASKKAEEAIAIAAYIAADAMIAARKAQD